MLKQIVRNKERKDRARRVRAKISGTSKRPRLSVFRSLRGIAVQVIDDIAGKTLVSAHLGDVKGAENTVEGALALGKLVGKKCQEAKIGEIVFDRSGYRYHGRIKALADGVRESGIKF